MGRILSGIAAAFFAFDLTGKLLSLQQTVDATTKLGYSANVLPPLGVVQLICLALYLIPRTAIIGAVLLTGYLGGAVATHVRANGSAFEILFPIIFGSIVWGGLLLRDPRVGIMIGPRQTTQI
jgi:hypothetical protein